MKACSALLLIALAATACTTTATNEPTSVSSELTRSAEGGQGELMSKGSETVPTDLDANKGNETSPLDTLTNKGNETVPTELEASKGSDGYISPNPRLNTNE
ncbi:MAG: hypothetical protein AAFY84_14770 [Pseudomonadota bacterium]